MARRRLAALALSEAERGELVRRSIHRSVGALQTAIATFIDLHNRLPPNWTPHPASR
jgi:hypothetical protein